MKKLHLFSIIILLALNIQNYKAQSITITGGGQWTLSAQETNHAFRFWISYNRNGLSTTSLHYIVDNNGVLIPSYPVGDNSNNPSYVDITLSEGNHTIQFIWYAYNWGTLQWYPADTKTTTSVVKFNVYVTNIDNGGTVIIDNVPLRPSGSAKTVVSGNSFNISTSEQDYGNYHRVWSTSGSYPSEWLRKKYQGSNSFVSSSQSTSYSVATDDNSTTLEAGLRKVCNLTFQASSSMYINGTSRTSPYVESRVEQNPFYADALPYTSNGLDYTFDHWISNGVSFSSTINPTAHSTFDAVYIARPSNASKNFASPSAVNRPIVITWVDNSNTAVNQYQIWRKVKQNGIMGSPVLLTTVGRGVQTYTDYEYAKTNGYTNDLILYDVRQYYSTEGTYSVEDWNTLFGQQWIKATDNSNSMNMEMEKPTTYSIGNYPNPFNPTTVINYQLPENGFVTIKVYDMLGKEVATLVNEQKSAGYHKATFDASKLTSGVYIYTISVNNFTQSKKMMLTK